MPASVKRTLRVFRATNGVPKRPSSAELRGVLRVSAAGEFAEQHLTPALIAFAKQHPKLSVQMDFNARFINIVEEGFDFAIRYGKLTGSGLSARKLIDRSMVAAASSEYLQKYGQPQHPNELQNHNCLITNSEEWRFHQQDQLLAVRVSGRWRANSGRCIVAAC